MKKYFMLTVAVLAMASCSKNTDVSNPNAVQENKEAQYADAFVKTFCDGQKIASNQTWGFNQTKAANPNGNEWASDGYTVPGAITEQELADVLAVFNQKGEAQYTAKVNWSNFFVQQVYKGVAHYTAGNGGDVLGSAHMDWLCAYDPVGYEVTNTIYWPEYKVEVTTCHDDHINNFNGGDCKDYNGIMLMVNSSTQRFGFKASEDNGHVFYNFRMEEINGNYYVGFDFEADGQNPNEQVARDYIYNDWIVKIVPADGVTPDEVKEQGRIICEDLGTIGDFDFNDVVFDAKVWKSGKTEITLLAAGGQLDISVAGVNVGDVMGKMVNTGTGNTHDPYYFVAANKYNSLIDIPIVVRSTDAAGNVTSYELTAEMGQAPQKICVPVGFKWCKEYKSLSEVYPGFKDWSTGAASTWTGSFDANNVYEAE